jgi:hypothetical protein
MQTTRIVQAVFLMMIVAIAASCAASKEYSSKLFSPRNENAKDSQVTALRFLELDSLQSEKEGWVTTDIIMGRDTGSKTIALDKLAKIFPAVSVSNDNTTSAQEEKTSPIVTETKPLPKVEPAIVRNNNPGEVRTKRIREK